MLTLYTVEAENALEHYQHHAIHVLGWEVRLDRSSPPATAYPPSPRPYFAKWEANASSLRSHFRALCSKIGTSTSVSSSPLPPYTALSGWPTQKRPGDADAHGSPQLHLRSIRAQFGHDLSTRRRVEIDVPPDD